MRFILSFLLTAALNFIAGLFLPWWSIAIIAFLVAALIPQRIGFAFLSGALGVFLCWAIIEAWIDIKNNHILSHKIAELFHLAGSSLLLIVVSSFVGALVGGFAAMAGASLHPAKRIRKY